MENMVEALTIKSIRELKMGEFFKLKENAKRVYIREEYDRSEKRYCCTAWDDICVSRLFDGNKKVFVGFTF